MPDNTIMSSTTLGLRAIINHLYSIPTTILSSLQSHNQHNSRNHCPNQPSNTNNYSRQCYVDYVPVVYFRWVLIPDMSFCGSYDWRDDWFCLIVLSWCLLVVKIYNLSFILHLPHFYSITYQLLLHQSLFILTQSPYLQHLTLHL